MKKSIHILAIVLIVLFSGCFPKIEMQPLVKTVAVGYTADKVKIQGEVIDAAGGAEYGYCFATHSGPTIEDNKVKLGQTSSPISFSDYFQPDKSGTYYIRTYVLAGDKQAYGDEISIRIGEPALSTNIGEVGRYFANIKASLENNGGAKVEEIGIYWSSSPGVDPQTAEGRIIETQFNVSDDGKLIFNEVISGLESDKTYYYRVFALNKYGIGYSSEQSFTTNLETVPVISESYVKEITYNTAVFGAKITDDGGSSVFKRGFCWGTSPNPDLNNNEGSIIVGSGTGEYTYKITDLKPGTTYYVRAFAVNSTGTGYAEQLQFTTYAVKMKAYPQVIIRSLVRN